MNLYTPILVLGAIAAAFAVGSVGIALLTGPRRYNRSKMEAYECGIEPVPQLASAHAAGHPWAVAFDSLGMFALVEMLLFMVVVFVAYAYVWRRGGLNWD
jgi:NADH-quinone oxidoreductase subunit A